MREISTIANFILEVTIENNICILSKEDNDMFLEYRGDCFILVFDTYLLNT